MTALAAAALAACAGAAALALLRWARVAQREHYLSGAVSRFAWRWWSLGTWQAALGLVALASAVAAVVTPWPALVAAAAIAAGPVGLSARGRTSPLRWTRRCATVAALAAVVVAAPAAIAGALGGLRAAVPAAALTVVAVPVVLDAVLALLAPLEERLARRFVDAARTRLRRVGPVVVAITGSYGKTTTKGYLAHLLSGRFSVVASPRSFNNRAGLARTVNELLVPGTDVLVAEMGAYGPGEIAALCAWLAPTVAVITAIGPVHLERFGSLERTLAAKAEIAAGADAVVLNVDDERLAGLAERLTTEGQRVLACSARDPGADVAVMGEAGGLTLIVGGERVGRAGTAGGELPPAMTNVACAAAAAIALGCSPAEVLERLGSLPATENRLQRSVASNGVVVLDDTFNANPAGAALALELLAATGAPGARRALITPGMVELGPLQAAENAAFARRAAGVVTDLVVVGRSNRKALLAGFAAGRGAARGGRAPQVSVVGTRDDAVAWVREHLRAGDVVLYENDLPDHFP
ncbi:MAG TPA: Mur ligase family protein [Acidimicrobiales bacterium]|nr:Mur ligase family protein [Acidimicrobiales bacterium]